MRWGRNPRSKLGSHTQARALARPPARPTITTSTPQFSVRQQSTNSDLAFLYPGVVVDK